jgi:hypothetical protein
MQMARKSIKRPRLNSRKRRRNRYLEEEEEKKQVLQLFYEGQVWQLDVPVTRAALDADDVEAQKEGTHVPQETLQP